IGVLNTLEDIADTL
ncbi:hypothetical protein Q7C09_07675, partial [Heyndrickxia coagulans]